MKKKIFISYSRADASIVKPLVKIIEDSVGIECWIDWNGIESGDQFEDNIVGAIDDCEIVLFMHSDNAIKSEWAKKEVRYASGEGKKVIPLLIDGNSLKGWYKFNYGGADFIDIRQQGHLDKLIFNLKEWITDCHDNSKSQRQTQEQDKYLLKIKPNRTCSVYIDDQKLGMAEANKLSTFPLSKGEYTFMCVAEDGNEKVELDDVIITDCDVLRKPIFSIETANHCVDKDSVDGISAVQVNKSDSKGTPQRTSFSSAANQEDEEQKEKEYNTLVKKLKEKLPSKLTFNISQEVAITFNLNATKTKYTATGIDKINSFGLFARPGFNSFVNYVGGDSICQELSKKEGLDVSYNYSVYVINVFPKYRRDIKFSNMNYFIEKYLPEYTLTKSGELPKTKQENEDVYIVCPHCKRKAKTDLKAIGMTMKEGGRQLDVKDIHAIASTAAIPATAALVGGPVGLVAGLGLTAASRYIKGLLGSDVENSGVEITCPHCYSKFTIKV